MNNGEINVLTLDTSTRKTRLSLSKCTEPLSVARQNILDRLDSTEKSSKLDQTVATSDGIDNFLQPFFKEFKTSESDPSEKSVIPTSSSQILIPQIKKSLDANQLQPDQIDLIVVALGPGSFTGLRIGVVAAKCYAFATGCDVVGISLMDAAAEQADWLRENRSTPLAVGCDAGRGDLLTATYVPNGGELHCQSDARIRKPVDWVKSLKPGTVVAGDGIPLIPQQLLDGTGIQIMAKETRMPALTTITMLGIERFRVSGPDNHWTLQPIYSRPSAAEESLQK